MGEKIGLTLEAASGMEADTEIPPDRCRPADQCRPHCLSIYSRIGAGLSREVLGGHSGRILDSEKSIGKGDFFFGVSCARAATIFSGPTAGLTPMARTRASCYRSSPTRRGSLTAEFAGHMMRCGACLTTRRASSRSERARYVWR